MESRMKKLLILSTFLSLIFSQDKFVTTDYDSRLLSDPNGNNMLVRIPKNTELKVLESREFQQGRMLNTWYKVSYKGKTGWTSSFNMKSPPKAKITSVQTMEKNYASEIGEKPKNNCYGGSVCIVRDWLYENEPNYKYIDFKVWHPVVLSDSKWVSRVEYTINKKKYDRVFYIKNDRVIDVKNKRR